MQKVTVVICTRNRCESLKDTLNSIANQQLDGSFDFEAIVVDNNSEDETKQIAEYFSSKYEGKFRYFLEKEIGISRARNRGIREAKGEIIIFTDDDTITDSAWLSSILQCFRKHDCDAVGGRTLPLFDPDVPQWIIDNQQLIRGVIGRHDYGNICEVYKKGKIRPMVGANMSFKKQCFEEVGHFNINFGQGTGAKGEETDLFWRLEKHGKKIYHCSNALVWHKVPRIRANIIYIAKWYMALGKFFAKQEGIEKGTMCYFGIPRYLITFILRDTLFLFFNVFNKREFLTKWNFIFLCIGKASGYKMMQRDTKKT